MKKNLVILSLLAIFATGMVAQAPAKDKKEAPKTECCKEKEKKCADKKDCPKDKASCEKKASECSKK